MEVASLDMFNGATLYNEMFDFKETGVINEMFKLMGHSDLNFMMNTGSVFIILFGLVIYYVLKKVFHKIAVKFPTSKWLRLISIKADTKNVSFIGPFLKLVLETYLTMGFACALMLYAFESAEIET